MELEQRNDLTSTQVENLTLHARKSAFHVGLTLGTKQNLSQARNEFLIHNIRNMQLDWNAIGRVGLRIPSEIVDTKVYGDAPTFETSELPISAKKMYLLPPLLNTSDLDGVRQPGLYS